MRFRYLAVGPWAGMSQDEIEAEIRRAEARANNEPEPVEDEDGAEQARRGES